MDPTRRVQLMKRCAVAKASLTRLQNFLEAGDLKVNEIKVRLDKLPSILNKYESAQDELESLDEADYALDREEFENQYYQVEDNFNDILHPVMTHRPYVAHQGAACQFTAITLRGHTQVAHILSYQPLHCQHSKVTHVVGYISETHLRH